MWTKFLRATSRPRPNLYLDMSSPVAAAAAGASPTKKAKLSNDGGGGSAEKSAAGFGKEARAIHDELKKTRRDNDGKVDFLESRVRNVRHNPGFLKQECQAVAYWMSRDQRVQDNWALIYAQKIAKDNRLPLHVVFCLVPKFLDATIRHYDFMLKGLREVEEECAQLDIPFHLLTCKAADGAAGTLPKFVKDHRIGCLVTDQSPLRTPRKWVEDVDKALGKEHKDNFCFYQVDAHNVVPVWTASDKQEYAARTIRGKIEKKLPEYLTQFPPVVKHPHEPKASEKPKKINWDAVERALEVDDTVGPVSTFKPGTKAGLENIYDFVRAGGGRRLKLYADKRNDPTKPEALSNISPWAHFGQISVQRAVLYVKEHKGTSPKGSEGAAAFIEEAVIRRELSDNFCYYQPKYDSLEAASAWAKETLKTHAKDKRDYVYSRSQFESANTHDALWNGAQRQMAREGKMHGFLRMYWAKKILEWSKSPEEALSTAIYLNDRYNLDGRDPNGYVGCMWSIAGIHDQGWAERKVYGKIRCMVYSGCKRKFDVAEFERKYRANV